MKNAAQEQVLGFPINAFACRADMLANTPASPPANLSLLPSASTRPSQTRKSKSLLSLFSSDLLAQVIVSDEIL